MKIIVKMMRNAGWYRIWLTPDIRSSEMFPSITFIVRIGLVNMEMYS